MRVRGQLTKDGAAVYGNAPAGFSITGAAVGVPVPGSTTLTLAWTAASPIPADGYRIRIRDVLSDITTYQDEAGLTDTTVITDASPDWELSVQSIYLDGILESAFSPDSELSMMKRY